MASATGTANSACDLMVKLNTFLTANGWTNLEGETDIAGASPKSARYWRILVLETEATNDDFRELELLEWRTTSGGANQATVGANYSFSNLASGSGNDLVSGTGTVQSADIDDAFWWVKYDFGVGTIIRELVMTVDTDNYAPRDFLVQWSNDDKVWTTMYEQSGLSWSDNETKTFTWDAGGGYTPPEHFSATICRRQGDVTDAVSGGSNGSERCNDVWAWQGTGYGANRRVYIGMVTDYDLTQSTEWIKIHCTTDWDAGLDNFEDNENFDATDQQYLVMGTDPVTYWFYANTSRVIIVLKNGADDYTSAYAGFIAAFAQPTEWAQPLYVGATNNDRGTIGNTVNDNGTFFQPGANGHGGKLFDFTNNWINVENLQSSGVTDLPSLNPIAWIWPWHLGQTGDGAWPICAIGDNDSGGAHWLDKLEPTEQNEMPILPAILMSYANGALGALDGVYAIPGGGLATPEQLVTIGGDDYRVFPHRDRRGGNHYMMVLED